MCVATFLTGRGGGRQRRSPPYGPLLYWRAYFDAPALIFTVLGFTDSDLGRTSSSTPFVNVAVTAFESICTGRVNARWNLPVRRSWRSQPSLVTSVEAFVSPARDTVSPVTLISMS